MAKNGLFWCSSSLISELNLCVEAMLLIILLKLISYSAAIHVEELTSTSGLKFPSDVTPNFVGPIRNVTVAAGREAVLSCSVTDLGHYKVGWMKADDQTILSLHTRVITHNPRISVTHDDHLRTWQLHIRQLKESDRGCYMCQINTNSMKKQLGCVDVQVPPDIDDAETSGDVTVSEGDNVTLGCKATGHPSPRILWRREDGDHILLHTKPQETQRVDTFSGSQLNLVNVERRQMGAYLCIASNDVPPAVSKRITLNINFSPTVQVQKALVGAPLGVNAKLKCDIQAFPHSDNYWIKEQDEDILNGMKYTLQEKYLDYRVVMTLTIHNVSKHDISSYKCVASNAIGKSEGTIRLYEIKIVTTTTTTTTTTTEAYKEMTTIAQSVETPLSSNTIDTLRMIEEDPMENWLFPSVAPAPLELETHSSSTVSSVFNLNATLLLLAGLTHTFR